MIAVYVVRLRPCPCGCPWAWLIATAYALHRISTFRRQIGLN